MEKVLILGCKGMLGSELVKIFGGNAIGWDSGDCDITEVESLKLKVESLKPTAIINCAAFNDVDGAEDNQELAFKLNAKSVKSLSEIANGLAIPLVNFSTNYVFDGSAGDYKEADQPNPLSTYAKSKFLGEQNLLNFCKKPYLVRTSVLFGQKGNGRHSKKSFVDIMLDLAGKTDTIKAVSDEVNGITYVPDLAKAVKNLLESQKPFGIYHITNSGSASWFEFAKEIFTTTRKKINLVPVSSSSFPREAIRPKKAVLINTKLPPLRPWQEALRNFLTPTL